MKPQREPALREPRTELEKAIVEHLEIKRPLVIPDPDGLHIISGNCFYCEEPWVYELEVATTHAEGELTGKTTAVYVCKDCRTRLTIPEERIRMVRSRGPVTFVAGRDLDG